MKHFLPLTALLLLTACVQPPNLDDYKSHETESDQLVEMDGDVLEGLSGGAFLTLPEGWSEAIELNDEADLQASNEAESLFGIVLTEFKEDFDIGLKEHSDITTETLLSNVENEEVIGPTDTTVAGFPAIQYQISAGIDGINVVYVHTTVETELYFHQVLLWTTKSQFRRNKDDLMVFLDNLSFED